MVEYYNKSRNNSVSNPSSNDLLRHLSESKLMNPFKNHIKDSNKTFHFPSIDKYIKRPNTIKSLNKLGNESMNKNTQNNKSLDLMLFSSKIVDVKQLNDEFKKPTIIRKKMNKSLSNDFCCQKDNMTKENFIPNKTIHNQFIGESLKFEKDSIEKDLNLYKRYSLYLIEMINRRLKGGKDFTPLLSNNLYPIQNQKSSSLLRNQFILDSLELNKYSKNIEISAKAIMKDLNRSEQKKFSYKEVALNNFFNDVVLENVFRRVKYLKANNTVICEDNVINLIHQEVICITNNVETLLKSPAFIKNFYFKQEKEKFALNNELVPNNEMIEITSKIRNNTSDKKFSLYSIKEGDDESRDEKTESKFLELIGSNNTKGKGRTESLHIDISSNLKLKFKQGDNHYEIKEEDEKDKRRNSFEIKSPKGKNIFTSLKKYNIVDKTENGDKGEKQDKTDENRKTIRSESHGKSKENPMNNKDKEMNDMNVKNNTNSNSNNRQNHNINKKISEENSTGTNDLSKKDDNKTNLKHDQTLSNDNSAGKVLNSTMKSLFDIKDIAKLSSQKLIENKIADLFIHKDKKALNNEITIGDKINLYKTNNNLIIKETGNIAVNDAYTNKGKVIISDKKDKKNRKKKRKDSNLSNESDDKNHKSKKDFETKQKNNNSDLNKTLKLISKNQANENNIKKESDKIEWKGNLNCETYSESHKKNLVLRIINTNNNINNNNNFNHNNININDNTATNKTREIQEVNRIYTPVLSNGSKYNSDIDSNEEFYEDDELIDGNLPENVRKRRSRKVKVNDYGEIITDNIKKLGKNLLSPEELGMDYEEIPLDEKKKRIYKILRGKRKKGKKIDDKYDNNEMDEEEYSKKMQFYNDEASSPNDLEMKNKLFFYNINQDINHKVNNDDITEEEKKKYEDLRDKLNSMKNFSLEEFVENYESNFKQFKEEIGV